jgi:hypothetical protein
VKDAKAVMEEVKRMKKESKLKKKFLKLENKRKNLGSETASWHVVVLWCLLKFVLFSAKIASHICLRKKLQKKLKKQAKGKGEKDDERSTSSSSTSSLSEATQARQRKDNWTSKRSWCSKTCLANQHVGVLPTFDKEWINKECYFKTGLRGPIYSRSMPKCFGLVAMLVDEPC